MLFNLYVGKILKALQRPLSQSERNKAREFFDNSYSVSYAIEYFS